jgi:hypothetical protein
MKKSLTSALLGVVLLSSASACNTFQHTIGQGAQGNTKVAEERQWFVLWGLIPINEIDGAELAGSRTDYTIQTQWSAVDVLINIFTGYITVYSRTVRVTE